MWHKKKLNEKPLASSCSKISSDIHVLTLSTQCDQYLVLFFINFGIQFDLNIDHTKMQTII